MFAVNIEVDIFSILLMKKKNNLLSFSKTNGDIEVILLHLLHLNIYTSPNIQILYSLYHNSQKSNVLVNFQNYK